MQDFTITIGHYSLVIALLAAAWSTIFALLSATTGRGALQTSAERALLACGGLVTLATGCLIRGFLTD